MGKTGALSSENGRTRMKKGRYTEEISGILKQREAWVHTGGLCREHCN